MRRLTIEYDDGSACYCGNIRDLEYNTIDSAVTGCKTLWDFKKWCLEHNVTRDEWDNASIGESFKL